MLVYTVVIAAVLAAFFDLGRIASLGAIFYLVMDIAIHWGVLRHLRVDVNAKSWVLVSAMTLDIVVLAAFLFIKGSADPMIVVFSIVAIAAIFMFEKFFLARRRGDLESDPTVHEHG